MKFQIKSNIKTIVLAVLFIFFAFLLLSKLFSSRESFQEGAQNTPSVYLNKPQREIYDSLRTDPNVGASISNTCLTKYVLSLGTKPSMPVPRPTATTIKC
jgi:hypothetical protein